jgi:hypothetical protein
LNFQNRKQIVIDENDDTFNAGEMESILQRGQRLQKQMAEALTTTSAWESIHG